MKKLSKFLISLAMITATSCVSDSNFRLYVAAHRLGHDAMAPHYAQYITNDQTLSLQDKETLKRRLAVEEEMISNAEKLLGIKP